MTKLLLVLFAVLLLPARARSAPPPKPAPAPAAKSAAGADETDEDDADADADADEEANPQEVKANIAFVSDYLSRGLTFSDHKPALQGGLDWAHPVGIFVGAWASSISVPDTNASLELDGFAGYSFSFGSGFEENLSVHYASYFSGERRANWSFESETKWRDFTADLGYSPSYREDGYSVTATAGWSHEVAWGIQLGLYLDYTAFEDKYLTTTAVETTVNSAGEEVEVQKAVYEPTPNYADVRLRVGHEFLGATWQAEGVYLRKQTIEGILAEPRVALSVSKEF